AVSASGSADAGANAVLLNGRITRAEQELAAQHARRDALNAEKDAAGTTPGRKTAIADELKILGGQIDRQQQLIQSLNDAYIRALTETATASTATGTLIAAEALASPQLPEHVSKAVERITLSALNQDYSLQVCVAQMRELRHG